MGFSDEMGDELDADWEGVPTGGGSNILPDASYQGQIAELRLEKDSRTDAWQVVAKFVADGGSARKWYNLDHPVGKSVLKGDLAMMGFTGKPSEMEAYFESEAAIGLVCDFVVKRTPGKERDFVNVDLNRVLGKEPMKEYAGVGADDGGSHAGVADDDIPF